MRDDVFPCGKPKKRELWWSRLGMVPAYVLVLALLGVAVFAVASAIGKDADFPIRTFRVIVE